MLLKHLYGLITFLVILTGSVTLSLGVLSLKKSGDRFLKCFLGVLAAFTAKFIIDLVWSYIILNIDGFSPVLFPVMFIGSGIADFSFTIFLLFVGNSLFTKTIPPLAVRTAATVLTAGYAAAFAGGSWDFSRMDFRPGLSAGIGNGAVVLVFLLLIVYGILRFREAEEDRYKFFLAATLPCAFLGLIQMASGFIERIVNLPDLVMRAPHASEIGFPWLSLYFGPYFAAVCYMFWKFYLLAPPVREPIAPTEYSPYSGNGAKSSTAGAALDGFCRSYSVSPREREILKLVLDGFGNEEIGKRLFISTGTVKTHMHNVFRKTETGSRAQLIRRILD